jgi:hypothetical protein
MVSMDAITLEWARDRIRDEVGRLAGDPQGYCGDDITPIAAWTRLEHIATDLGMDAVAILLEDRTPFEIARLRDLTGRKLG